MPLDVTESSGECGGPAQWRPSGRFIPRLNRAACPKRTGTVSVRGAEGVSHLQPQSVRRDRSLGPGRSINPGWRARFAGDLCQPPPRETTAHAFGSRACRIAGRDALDTLRPPPPIAGPGLPGRRRKAQTRVPAKRGREGGGRILSRGSHVRARAPTSSGTGARRAPRKDRRRCGDGSARASPRW